MRRGDTAQPRPALPDVITRGVMERACRRRPAKTSKEKRKRKIEKKGSLFIETPRHWLAMLHASTRLKSLAIRKRKRTQAKQRKMGKQIPSPPSLLFRGAERGGQVCVCVCAQRGGEKVS